MDKKRSNNIVLHPSPMFISPSSSSKNRENVVVVESSIPISAPSPLPLSINHLRITSTAPESQNLRNEYILYNKMVYLSRDTLESITLKRFSICGIRAFLELFYSFPLDNSTVEESNRDVEFRVNRTMVSILVYNLLCSLKLMTFQYHFYSFENIVYYFSRIS